MTNDNEVAHLLQENIDAQNRTTHAVRAFVRFFFIQLVAVTIALPLLYFGTLDAPGLVFIAFVVLVVGIVWSSNAGWTELALSDRLASAREAARALRQAQKEIERGIAAKARETAAVARRELFASRRFRMRALVGAGVALTAVATGTAFVLIGAAERATQSESLPGTYRLAVDDCASSVGVSEAFVGRRHVISGTTLVLRYQSPGANVDDFVDCVASALTGRSASDLDPGLPQERGDLILLKGETGASLTIRPTP